MSNEIETKVQDLIQLASTILESSQKNQASVATLMTTVAVIDNRVKTLENIIWPLVLTCLTGIVGAILVLILKR